MEKLFSYFIPFLDFQNPFDNIVKYANENWGGGARSGSIFLKKIFFSKKLRNGFAVKKHERNRK